MSAGLSLGREGPSVQIGSYIGTLVSRWGHILKGERKQLLAAGAGAGLSAAFAAPLSSSLLVIESIERFDAPKTAITTLLAGVVAGGKYQFRICDPTQSQKQIRLSLSGPGRSRPLYSLNFISCCFQSSFSWAGRIRSGPIPPDSPECGAVTCLCRIRQRRNSLCAACFVREAGGGFYQHAKLRKNMNK